MWFIRTVNKVFDIFNSRNIFGHDFKGPLTPENAEHFLTRSIGTYHICQDWNLSLEPLFTNLKA